jgi:hypothetical protein
MAFITSQSGSFAVIIGVILILGLLGFGLFKLAKPYGWILQLLGDLSGQQARPGVPARPGLMERQATTEAQLSQALEILTTHTERLRELEPNHGGTIKDQVRETHASITTLADTVESLRQRVNALDDAAHTSSTTVNIHTTEGGGTE